MARLRSAPRTTISDDLGSNPSRVQHANEVADREERKRLLSAILRDGKATGAEAVAAARLLEAMERTGTAGEVGIPLPTSRPEQVARIVRILTAAGKTLTLEALDIIAKRSEQVKASGFKPRGFTSEEVKEFRRRINRPEGVESFDDRANKRPRPNARRAAAAKSSGLPELHQDASPVGTIADPDERDGVADPGRHEGERASASEAGGGLD